MASLRNLVSANDHPRDLKGGDEEIRGETHRVCYRRGGEDSSPRDRLSPTKIIRMWIRDILCYRGVGGGGVTFPHEKQRTGIIIVFFDIWDGLIIY